MALREIHSQHYSWRKKLAIQGELCAAEYLSNLGYTIITRNWRAGRHGEIDIIAKAPANAQDESLVFVEVKTRIASGTEDGIYPLGFEAINKAKQLKIMRSAWRFQQTTKTWASVRFDAIVVIYRVAACYDREIIHVPNAFAPSNF